jgi:hypothetical protein
VQAPGGYDAARPLVFDAFSAVAASFSFPAGITPTTGAGTAVVQGNLALDDVMPAARDAVSSRPHRRPAAR